MSSPQQPVVTIKSGSIWIPIYRYEYPYRSGVRIQFRFTYTEHGKTKAVTASNLEKLKELAKERAQLIMEGRLTEPSPIQEQGLIDKCKAILGGSLEHLIPACVHYAQTVLSITENKTIGESVDEYLEERQPQLTAERYRYVKRIVGKLNRFAKTTAITSQYLDDIVKTIKAGQRTRYDTYTALATYIRWADKKGHLADAELLLNRVTQKGKATEGKREIFTAEELRKLMDAAAPNVQTIFALCGFGGLRKSESLRLRWEQIDLDDNVIRLEGEQVKTATRRAVEILPTLKAWLELVPVDERKGNVWGGTERSFLYHQQMSTKKAGVTWKDNGLRHTAISARCCNGLHLGAVADWAGNSVGEIKKHYLQLISKSDAQSWWNIYPLTSVK